MLHAQFQDHWTFVLEKKSFKGFYHTWAWQQSWLCDRKHFYKFMSPFPKEAPMKFGFDFLRSFRGKDV